MCGKTRETEGTITHRLITPIKHISTDAFQNNTKSKTNDPVWLRGSSKVLQHIRDSICASCQIKTQQPRWRTLAADTRAAEEPIKTSGSTKEQQKQEERSRSLAALAEFAAPAYSLEAAALRLRVEVIIVFKVETFLWGALRGFEATVSAKGPAECFCWTEEDRRVSALSRVRSHRAPASST